MLLLLSFSHQVHIDVTAAMTGITRFCEQDPSSGWRYSKDEKLTDFSAFDYLLTGNATGPFGTARFEQVAVAHSFSRVDFRGFRMETKPLVYTMRRVKEGAQEKGD